MKKVTAFGTYDSSGLKISNRNLFKEMMKGLTPGKVRVTVERVYKNRSLLQNDYYHAVVIPICTKGLIDLGHRVTIDDTHEILLAMFNKREFVNEKTGEVTTYGGRSKEMTTTDMMAYFEEINQWAAEYLGVMIPDPDPNYKQSKKEI